MKASDVADVCNDTNPDESIRKRHNGEAEGKAGGGGLECGGECNDE